MQTIKLPATRTARGHVVLPGSKSLSNRALLLAALARGHTKISNLADGEDIQVMFEALRRLGVSFEKNQSGATVKGGWGAFSATTAELDLGNAGTAYRPLTAALALSKGHYILRGEPRMYERPIGELVKALTSIGAHIRYLEKPGFPPLEIKPADVVIHGPVILNSHASSQFLSALLMALPLTGKTATLQLSDALISQPYVKMTMNMMEHFQVKAQRLSARVFEVSGATYVSPGNIQIEGDASGASYFLAAGAIAGGPVRVVGVGEESLQGDIAFAHHLARLGAQITWGKNWIECSAPKQGKLKAFNLDCNDIPDAAMTLASLALFCDGVCTIRNVASWRVKETDRLDALCKELSKTGAKINVGPDWMEVSPLEKIPSAIEPFDTYRDHRMAMCLSLVSLAGASVIINDPNCVQKTFPNYFKNFIEITQSHSA